MHEEGTWRATEVAAAEDAVAATLSVLPALLRTLEMNATTSATASASGRADFNPAVEPLGGSALALALLVEAPWGGPPLAAAVASYAAYPYAAACCPLVLPALASLCAAAPAEPPLACALPSLAPRASKRLGVGFGLTLLLADKEDAGSSGSDMLDARAAVAEVNPAFTAVLFAARILRLVAAAFSATDFLGVLGRSGRRASLL